MDINILLQIATFWWQAEVAPFPAIETIAQAIGVTPRTAPHRITAMERTTLIERKLWYCTRGSQKSNAYSFDGLIGRCTPFAAEAIAEEERRKAKDRARVQRRRPPTALK